MVDVGEKPVTTREAVARGRVVMKAATARALRESGGRKGDPIEVARLAGIMAAKRTADMIPLCHPLPLTHVDVTIRERRDGFDVEAVARTAAQTGVEMEALTAVAIAALTVYDMCKALDKSITIGDIRLVSKRGGKTGEWVRSEEQGAEEQGLTSEESEARSSKADGRRRKPRADGAPARRRDARNDR